MINREKQAFFPLTDHTRQRTDFHVEREQDLLVLYYSACSLLSPFN